MAAVSVRIAMAGATMAVAAVGAAGIVALAKPKSAPAPKPAPTTATPAAKPEPAAALPSLATVREHLAALGARRLTELTASVASGRPWESGVPEEPYAEAGDAESEKASAPVVPRTIGAIAALGPEATCARPTAEERAAVGKALAAADPAMRTAISASLRFGCKERGGMVVDIDYVPAAAGGVDARHDTEVWKVVRVSEAKADARVTVLGRYSGEAKDIWMEWSNEVTLGTMLLADLDGDGVRDAILIRDQQEGGAMEHYVGLSVWLSQRGQVVALDTAGEGATLAALGMVGGGVTLAAQTWAPGAPLVLRAETRDHEYKPQLRYRCLQPAGRLDLCPAIEPARRTERAFELAQRFVDHQVCEPDQDCELDRELLAVLLDELGAAPADRAQLLAEVEPARPAAQVQRAIAAGLAAAAEPKVLRAHGEEVATQPEDPRHPELMKLLGDEGCAPVPAAQQKQLAARVDRWIAGNGARLLVERGDCKAGQRCQWKRPQSFQLGSACAEGARGHLVGRWTHLDGQGELLAVDALFHVDGEQVKLVTSASVTGDAAECAACAGPPEAQLEVQLYRRGAALMALVWPRPYGPSPYQLSVSVDGAPTALPPLDSIRWYRFSAPMNAAVAVESLLEWGDPTEVAYWHWDGGWKELARFPRPQLGSVEPKLAPAGAWIWRQHRRVAAQEALGKLDAEKWASEASYREEIRQALVLAGVDAAVQARVAAVAKGLP